MIKTWFHGDGSYNHIKGELLIKNNYFSDAKDHYITYHTNKDTYPKIVDNIFFGKYDSKFANFGDQQSSPSILYDSFILNDKFPRNVFNILDKKSSVSKNASGKTGDVDWSFNPEKGLLKISGSGAMQNYEKNSLAPWHKYKDSIYKIEIGENITKLGNYAFYDLSKVYKIRIDSKSLANLSYTLVNGYNQGNNYVFSNVGIKTTGVEVTFGPEVTKIPAALLNSNSEIDEETNPFITDIRFEGNKVTSLSTVAITRTSIRSIKFPEGFTTLSSSTLEGNRYLSFVVMPDSLVTVKGITSQFIEKMVFGPSIVPSAIFSYSLSKKIIAVIPHVEDTSAGLSAFKKTNATIDVYGDSTTKEWINNVIAQEYHSINYHPLSEYKSTITSNTGINAIVDYNGEYIFTSSGNVTIKMYYDSSDGRRCYVDADYTKNGNTYTIKHIKSDVYIEIK